MDFQLNDDQSALVAAVQSMLAGHAALPQSEKLNYCYFDAALQALLVESGFVDAGRAMDPLAAALVAVECARIPAVVEVAASALVVPAVLGDEPMPGPVAVIPGNALQQAHRNLTIARTVLIDLGEDAGVLTLGEGDVEPVDTIYAYPYGRLTSARLQSVRRVPGGGARLRQWWRVALAAEFAGATQSAVNFTIDYVKERKAFGRPIGSFQALQHRLVQCQQIAMGTHYLALRAAWSGEPYHADLAACYAQQHVGKLILDLHQFNGAMGVTNEHLLHFWTYRLRALQSEAGGVYGAAQDVTHWLERGAAGPSHGRAHEQEVA